ncbi:MAG: hypothetical protein M3033_00940, partial [Acidobacteriota bacterium]|nr:hypothetical protein [Acidobacteriota bacterium]
GNIASGDYTVVLTVNGKTYAQPLTVKIDPRVKTSVSDLQKQFDLSKRLYDNWLLLQPINKSIGELSAQLAKAKTSAGQNATLAANIDALGKKLNEAAGAPNAPLGASLSIGVFDRLQTLFSTIQEVDAAPTPTVETAANEVLRASQTAVERWRAIESSDLPELNRRLKAARLQEIKLDSVQQK